MHMPQVAFDTLAYAKKLKQAGVDPKIAEAHAEAQVEVLSEIVDRKLATKGDVEDLRGDVNTLKMDVKDLREDVRDLDVKIDQVEIRLSSRIDHVENKMESLKNELLIKMGGIMVTGIGLIVALQAIFHFVQ
jgi:uncharacterized protein YlxW (UPF0749 family)